MEISLTESESGPSRVKLAGRMDSAGVDRVETRFNAATAARETDVVVDLSLVSFLASMGIRMLVAAAKVLAAKGHRMVLLNPQGMVDEYLRDAALDQLLPVAHNEDELGTLFEVAPN
jgi:anti-anti-sigma factor